MRIIDADEILDKVKALGAFPNKAYICEAIRNAPTIDAVPMREATAEERESVNAYVESISEPTGVNFTDTISRAEAIEAVRLETGKLGRGLLGRGDILDILSALPSVDRPSEERLLQEIKHLREQNNQLEELYTALSTNVDRPTGEWHDSWGFAHCSICGRGVQRPIGRKTDYKFCPYCGAELSGGEE